MSYTVTRQHQYPDGDFVVEISSGGFDNVNPGCFCSYYSGEGETFASAVQAVEVAIAIQEAWQADEPDEEIEIAMGNTLGATCNLEADEKEALLERAKKLDEEAKKCDCCGGILGDKTWKLSDDWSGEIFCSEYCAEKTRMHSEESEQEDDSDEEDDIDYSEKLEQKIAEATAEGNAEKVVYYQMHMDSLLHLEYEEFKNCEGYKEYFSGEVMDLVRKVEEEIKG